MRYVSTRGAAPELDFEGAMLAGLARDGGLYVPAAWPRLGAEEWRGLAGLSYADLATALIGRFVGDAVPPAALKALVAETYAGFRHAAVAPLRQLDREVWLMELFHGPTLAFKDYALQLLGRLFDHVLARRGARLTIVGATSGDTGSAAIEACRDRERVDIFILYPHGRVSEVQRRQMTSVRAGNVHAIAVDGSFDDCQDLVKAMFADAAFRDRVALSAVNSINWARILAQVVYYAHAALSLGAPGRSLSFAVPTGNFGNVYAGYVARAMGLPIERLAVATNANDILARYFAANDMSMRAVEPTASPSMDIQVSSNFERLLFDLLGRDGGRVATSLQAFRASGRLPVEAEAWAASTALFSGFRLDDAGTQAEIRRVHAATGEVLDPHTAIGTAAAQAAKAAGLDGPIVALATAHPAKFPEVVERAVGRRPALPDHLADLYARPERVTRMASDRPAIQAFITERARAASGGSAGRTRGAA